MKIEDETQQLLNQGELPLNKLTSIAFSQMDHVIQSKDIPYCNQRLQKQLGIARFLPDSLIEQDYYSEDELITNQLRRLFSKNFIMIGMLKLISIIFLFFTPVLMQQLTNSLDQSLSIFTYYSLGLLASTLLSAITDTQYNYQIKQLEIKSKAFLTEKIYQSLDSCSKSDVLNLINIDINSVINFFISFHECWSLILKLLIGLSILYVQIQEAVFVGFITALVLMLINFAIARKIGIYYSDGLVYKDQRMKLLKEFASNPKSIKFLKWEEKQQEKIQKVRSKEFKIIQGSKWLDSMCVLFWAITNTMISTITLYVYSQKNQLDDVFTIIYLFSLLTNPLNSLPWTVSGMLQAKTSFERINEFVVPILVQKVKLQGISINQAKLKWEFDDPFVLQINHFQAKKLTFIIGPTKSGKTSFILSLLNQMKTESGYFEVNAKFSYVPQQHWIQSGSVRDNILMGSEFNEVYYKQCLNDSQLIDDILQLENQDFFDVGPQGQKLSGGQKQRLSICRALYNSQDLFLFDDIFSSLDPQVADTVFQNIIKRNDPIIMILNDACLLRYLKYSNQIILLENGTLIYDEKSIKFYIDTLNPIDLNDLAAPQQKIKEKQQDIDLQIVYQDQNNTPIVKNTNQSIQFYLRNLGLFNLIWITISLILMQISFNLYDYWLNSYINGSAVFLISSSFTITIFGLTIIDFIIKSSRAFSFAFGNLNQAKRIFNNLLHNVIYAKCSFYDREESGQILTRFSDDQNVVDNRFPFELNLLCNNVVNFLGTFIILIVLQWYLVFPTIISIYIFYRLQQKYRPTSLPLRRLESQTNAQLVNDIFEQYQGIIIIKAFNKELAFKQFFTNSLLNSIRASWASKVLALWLQLRLQFVAGFIVFCILVLAFISLYFQLPISSSTLQLLLYYSLTKIGLFKDLTLSMTTCEQELISYERISQYCEMEIELNQQLNQSDPSNQIQLQNLSLQYDDGTVALNNISLSIQQGSRIAFCGRTGSGKSSILSAIYFLYPYQNGDIRVPASTIQEWRAKVGVIPQNGYVFDGTLKDNLDHEDNTKIQQIMNLDPSQHVDPSTISQGFRQLISFARVMLQNCELIFMDEATASVDQKIEDYIHNYLRECGKTIITISHRLETLQDYDQIFYLEKGQIKETGTFEELIKLKGGFSKLRNL